ncbi:fluoride efflux transporter FluC [Sphingomonas sp.]
MSYLLVMAGGALGAAGRHGVNRLTVQWLGYVYPWATLFVNVVGSLIMGLVIGALARIEGGHEPARLFLCVGILGGFTTFSAFSLEMANMLDRGDLGAALGYALASVVGSVLAVYAGLMLMRVTA